MEGTRRRIVLVVVALALAAAGALLTRQATASRTVTPANLKQGRLFFVAACGSCHTLAAAGTHGTRGPNLADEAPDFGDVIDQVTFGGDGMPAFGKSLTRPTIRNIAAYVSTVTAGGARGDD